jgi:hypothetical protein
MKPPLQRIRLCIFLLALAVALNGCLFGEELSVTVLGTSVFISAGDIDLGLCGESDPAVFLCSFGEIFSTFQTLSTPELLVTLFLLDPVVLQLPAGVTNFTGSFLHNTSGTSGALAITAGLTSLPIDAERTLVAEPGTQFVVIGLPAAAPTTGSFSFNFNFDVPPGTSAIQVKPILTGRAELGGGTVFYPPLLPCVTDIADVPALTVPLPVPGDTLTLPPPSADLGCRNVVYNLVPGGAVPQALVVDSGGNGVLEPGETATVAPAWRRSGGGSLAGTAAGFTGPATPGLTYGIADSAASYGVLPPATTVGCDTIPNCYAMTLSSPPGRPVPHWDAKFQEQLSTGVIKTWTLHVGDSFTDVPRASPFYPFIETIFHRGVTGGCSAAGYCPGSPTTREQMAAFIIRARGEFAPPQPATQRFPDVPPTSPFYRFVERMAVLGITFGCGGGNYCPGAPISREQMAAFIIRALGEFAPPQPATQRFLDVPSTNPFYRFIDRMAVLGITGGCGGGNYCPADPVTREQMSVFLSVAFGLTLYGP